MESRVEVKPTLIASGLLDDLSETCKMNSPNGRPTNKFEDEVPLSTEIHQSESTQVDALGSHSGVLQADHYQKFPSIVYRSIRVVVFSNKLNLLMPFGPIAILVHKLTDSHGWVFGLSLLGIMPLAERLGYATEQLAFYTGDTVGGLLNATFGNATELIISLYALKSGMTRVVQLSLLGSILSNMLLVLGCAFFCGGIVFHKKEQVFNKATATVNSGLLLMAVMGLLFPAVLHYTHTEVHFGKSELALSRFSSCVMLVAYAAYLFFQLKSQKSLYVPVNEVGSFISFLFVSAVVCVYVICGVPCDIIDLLCAVRIQNQFLTCFCTIQWLTSYGTLFGTFEEFWVCPATLDTFLLTSCVDFERRKEAKYLWQCIVLATI